MEFNFVDNQTVANLDKVPKDFHGLYVADGDAFKLDTANDAVKSAVSAITGLNKALVAARGEVRTLKGQKVDLSALSEYGTDPESILAGFSATLTEAQASAKGEGNEDLERQVGKIKEELAQGHAQEKEGMTARIKALTGQLHGLLVTGEAKSALGEANALDSDLALPFLERQVKVIEEDGEFKVNVLDDAKDVRYSGTTGAPMTIKELVTEMKSQEKYGPLFKSESPSGGSTPATHRPRPQGATADMTPTEKIAVGLDKMRRR